jgi:hypothetical protein
MYNDCKVHVQVVGREKRTIDYLTGVQQGNNLAPLLFLFLMLAVSKTTEKNWKYKTPTVGHFKSNKRNRSRQLKNQNYRTKGYLLDFFHLLFVDDSIFLFESLQDIKIGAQTIHDHYAQFGLVIHVGRGDKK